MTLDIHALPSQLMSDVQTFLGSALPSTRSSTTNSQWYEWIKPRGAGMVQIFVLGAGGGGGTSYNAGAGIQRQGGGGGGSGAQSRLVIPAMFLPDRLYIQVGHGGGAGVSGVRSGDNGGASYVCVSPDTNTDNILVYAAGGGGANNGQPDGSGAPGSGGAVATLANMPIGGAGSYDLVAGQSGGAGGSYLGGAGTSITPPTTGLRAMGGTGGAGVFNKPAASGGYDGGAFNVSADTYMSEQAPPTALASTGLGVAGGTGASWMPIWKPFTMFGGGGGGSSYNAAGGAGGSGSYGAGGGGGGAGATLGAGGSGGPGLVLITTW